MIGSRIAHFEITAHLGSGGMGEVYQANDIKLGRSVAVKILPEVFEDAHLRVFRVLLWADDSLGKAKFRRNLLGVTRNRRVNARRNASGPLKPTDSAT